MPKFQATLQIEEICQSILILFFSLLIIFKKETVFQDLWNYSMGSL